MRNDAAITIHRQSKSRYRNAWAILGSLTIVTGLAGPARGQGPMNAGLAGQLRLFQVRIVSGRIQAVSPPSTQSMSSSFRGTDRRERLSIDLSTGQPTVSYERVTPREHFSYVIMAGDHVVIRQIPRSSADQPTVAFFQQTDGPVTLTVTSGDDTEIYQGTNLWQLLLIEPDACRRHLLPLVETMRPGWLLARQADAIEELLCQGGRVRSDGDRRKWQQAVVLLGSSRYSDRERAEEQLAAAGQRVLSFLQGQDRRQLDAEQWFRMRRIIRQLSGGGEEDTPDRVAFWLADDPRAWFAILSRASVSKRRTATEKLGQLLEVTLPFDPDAPADEREAQLERLKERFGATLSPAPVAVNDA
ncbi:MAG: hypothetical protein HYX69_15465 [Planctomycetia bacterium]|nr:hypothetical protein [Planctomycetia bacterium]